MIAMFLKTGLNYGVSTIDNTEYENYLFNGEREISNILAIMIVVSVPLFLCVKPCVALCCGPKHHEDEHAEAQFEEIAANRAIEGSDTELLRGKGDLVNGGGDSAEVYKADLKQWEAILVAEYGPQGHHGGVGELFIH